MMVLIKALLIRGTLNYKCNEQNITYSSLAHPSTKYPFINFSCSETSYNEHSHVLLNICVRFHNFQNPLRISLLKTCSKGTPFFFQRTFYSQDTFYKSRWTRHSSSVLTNMQLKNDWIKTGSHKQRLLRLLYNCHTTQSCTTVVQLDYSTTILRLLYK
jgi:hypothetical protein